MVFLFIQTKEEKVKIVIHMSFFLRIKSDTLIEMTKVDNYN